MLELEGGCTAVLSYDAVADVTALDYGATHVTFFGVEVLSSDIDYV